MIRVGKIKNCNDRLQYPGFETIMVMTKSSKYGSLSPYELRDDEGKIMENIWQFSKVYEKVPCVTQRYSRWDKTVIWQHPSQTHVNSNGELLPDYWDWRDKGMNNNYAVRYPVGISHRGKCLYSLTDEGDQLDYIEARKQIYLSLYCSLVRRQVQYQQLLQKLRHGINLLIVEVDGPCEQSLDYYIAKYGVSDSFIDNSTMLATRDNLELMLNDSRHPFGHGYCLAWSLLEDI